VCCQATHRHQVALTRAVLCCLLSAWLRRSFEREMYVIPNAVFSKNTVLNVTRKQREWRFYEFLCVRVQDVHKVNAIIQVSS
jgi:small-conductance mechanosensitive channel